MISGVRLRVTALAVVITGVALAVGGWGLVRSIEHTQLGRIASAVEAQVDLVAGQLEQGVVPSRISYSAAAPVGPGAAMGTGMVQVIRGGDVLTASPGFPSQTPLLVVAGDAVSRYGELGPGTFIATSVEGGGTVEVPTPSERAAPFQLEYRTVATSEGDLTVVAASPLDEVRRSIADVRTSLWVGLPLLTVLVGILTWLVAGRALRPVEAIRREVEAITHSTLHRRVPEPAADDEVRRLARTMNAMLDRLEGSAERQRRFVSDASHELRSPVAALRTELEVARPSDDAAVLRSAIDGALAEERRLEALLADLLLLASVDEAVPQGTDDVDLAALVHDEALVARRVPVVVEPGSVGGVAGSARQLGQVVANLLDNAARHATTSVRVAVEGSRITVDDDGPGIPEADRERVFERFTRLDEGRARDAGGAGLGLSIVRAVVSRHGGTVRVQAAPSGGARFVVDLAPSG